GVDGSTLVTVPDEATGVALILVDRLGENCIAVAGGANARLTPVAVRTALDRIALVEGDVVLVGHEIPTETAHEALVRARRLGATTILNPAPPSGLRPETLALADILTPNRTEAAQLAKEAAQLAKHDDELEALAAELVSRLATGGHVLISLGPAGALLVGADGVIAIEAPTVDAIDTVGAGDTLNGALAAGLAAGRGLEEAARRAVVAASLSVTRTGAREGMPGAAALDVALQG
ncbi:MAG: PfkB family carbohydrate kinase, partial [Candidatus Limnocylindrales bacterium]